MELDHYSEVPAHIQEKLVAAAKASLSATSEED